MGDPSPTDREAPLVTTAGRGSVTRALDDLKVGEHVDTATRRLWDHTFSRLIHVARKMIRNPGGDADEEDIALSALNALCDGVMHGQFPDLASRDNLWQVLYTITLRKVLARNTREKAQRRDVARRVDADLDAVVDREPGPEFAVMLVDELRYRLNILRDDGLRQVAKLILEGLSNLEIARQLDCHVRTIERKRNLIRKTWEREQGP
jgi:DNA-directed RNA polymerase specialized sigma24 family protein